MLLHKDFQNIRLGLVLDRRSARTVGRDKAFST
jgi:hypothetical protein